MSERLAESIREIVKCHLGKRSAGMVDDGQAEEASRFIFRITDDSRLTRDENPYSHFCVFFAGFDRRVGKVFLGHHKKADQWLFNGGHIDKEEVPLETLRREMDEEWGKVVGILELPERPLLLTTTLINNTRQVCRLHYNVWYFIELNSGLFAPDESKVAEEFYKVRWLSLGEARQLVTDPSTLVALKAIEELVGE